MANPFKIKLVTSDADFCNRTAEQKALTSHIKNRANVVLYSPRRFGKTSMMKRIQERLPEDKFICVYVDFFGVSSLEEMAERIAKGVYSVIHQNQSLLKKALSVLKSFRPVIQPDETGVSISVEQAGTGLSGIKLLSRTMEELGALTRTLPQTLHIVFDEFQEIVELKNSALEGVLRSGIQEHDCSYFFIGSRRSLLLAMFTEAQRPFYQSAFLVELSPLPKDELSCFIVDKFTVSGKACPMDVAILLVEKVQQHPYYSQKLAYLVYESAEKSITTQHVEEGFQLLLQEENVVFEASLQGLAAQQIALFRAIANQPTKTLMSTSYMKSHNLKSLGGIQGAIRKLTNLDLIEKQDDTWRVVDPVFEQLLKQK